MSSLKFGTSGLRGLVTDLRGAPSYDYTLAFVRALGHGGGADASVLIGRDLRSSSPDIAAAAAAAVRDAGFRPLDCGSLPTPALAAEALRRGWLGVMVTGSHIPDDRNGLKFYTGRGEITKPEEQAITAAVAPGGSAPTPEAAESYPDALARFRARYVEVFAPDALAGLRVGVYQQSTVARDLLVDVLAALGADVAPFGRASAFIPVDTEAHRPEDLATLREAAAPGGFDAIVTADGDADRPLVADASGRVLPGDVVGAIAARHLGIGTIAVPVTAGSAIETTGGFGRVVRTRVGSPFVIEGMERALAEGSGPMAGFESNGGFLLGSDLEISGRTLAALPTRDAMLPILAVLAAARAAQAPVAALVSRLGFRPTASHRIQGIPPERSGPFLASLAREADRTAFLAPLGTAASVDAIDGLRIRLADGRIIHFRASGNAPELRCYAEADTLAEAERMVAWGLAAAAAAT